MDGRNFLKPFEHILSSSERATIDCGLATSPVNGWRGIYCRRRVSVIVDRASSVLWSIAVTLIRKAYSFRR